MRELFGAFFGNAESSRSNTGRSQTIAQHRSSPLFVSPTGVVNGHEDDHQGAAMRDTTMRPQEQFSLPVVQRSSPVLNQAQKRKGLAAVHKPEYKEKLTLYDVRSFQKRRRGILGKELRRLIAVQELAMKARAIDYSVEDALDVKAFEQDHRLSSDSSDTSSISNDCRRARPQSKNMRDDVYAHDESLANAESNKNQNQVKGNNAISERRDAVEPSTTVVAGREEAPVIPAPRAKTPPVSAVPNARANESAAADNLRNVPIEPPQEERMISPPEPLDPPPSESKTMKPAAPNPPVAEVAPAPQFSLFGSAKPSETATTLNAAATEVPAVPQAAPLPLFSGLSQPAVDSNLTNTSNASQVSLFGTSTGQPTVNFGPKDESSSAAPTSLFGSSLFGKTEPVKGPETIPNNPTTEASSMPQIDLSKPSETAPAAAPKPLGLFSNSIMGSDSTSAPPQAPAISLFGQPPTTNTGGLFGTTKDLNIGSNVLTQSSQPGSILQPTTNQTQPTTSLFGNSSSIFGATSAPAPISQPNSGSLFGGNNSSGLNIGGSSLFPPPQTGSQSTSGNTLAPTTSSSIFGSGGSLFGNAGAGAPTSQSGSDLFNNGASSMATSSAIFGSTETSGGGLFGNSQPGAPEPNLFAPSGPIYRCKRKK